MRDFRTLSEFIKAVGEEKATKMFGRSSHTIHSWKLCRRYPGPKKAKEIIKKTRNHKYGPVTWEGIYQMELKTK